MKIFQINARMGVLSNEAKQSLQTVIGRMDAGREFVRNGMRFSDSRIVRCELPQEGTKLVHGIIKGETLILTKNREYIIDNKSGEVSLKTNLFKHLFISGKKVLKNISNTIEAVKNNFDNSEIVQQFRLIIEGFTEEGAKRL